MLEPMTLSSHHDVIVVGLGALGAATLYQLSQRGARVLGIDQFAPPHDQGSSHGDSRITRLAVGEGDEYVPFVQRSHAIWRELEARTGKPLMTTTGGLILAPRDRVAEHHGKSDFVRRTIACAERFGIAHEVLDAAGIRARFPQFRLQGDEIGYHTSAMPALFGLKTPSLRSSRWPAPRAHRRAPANTCRPSSPWATATRPACAPTRPASRPIASWSRQVHGCPGSSAGRPAPTGRRTFRYIGR